MTALFPSGLRHDDCTFVRCHLRNTERFLKIGHTRIADYLAMQARLGAIEPATDDIELVSGHAKAAKDGFNNCVLNLACFIRSSAFCPVRHESKRRIRETHKLAHNAVVKEFPERRDS